MWAEHTFPECNNRCSVVKAHLNACTCWLCGYLYVLKRLSIPNIILPASCVIAHVALLLQVLHCWPAGSQAEYLWMQSLHISGRPWCRRVLLRVSEAFAHVARCACLTCCDIVVVDTFMLVHNLSISVLCADVYTMWILYEYYNNCQDRASKLIMSIAEHVKFQQTFAQQKRVRVFYYVELNNMQPMISSTKPWTACIYLATYMFRVSALIIDTVQ